MSRTISRGVHDAGKWLTPALAARDSLEKRLGALLEPGDIGALMAIERFLTAAREGALGISGKREDSNIPVMMGLSAFRIATDVCGITIRRSDAASSLAEVERQLSTVRTLLEEKKIAGRSELRKSLRTFLGQLIDVGQRAPSRQFPR